VKLYKEINKNPSIAWITEKIIDRRINSEYYDVSNLSQSEKLSSMEYISKYFDLSKKRFDPNKYKKQTFKYIDISNVDINTGKYEISVIDKFEAPSRARKKVDKGDILISTVRPNRNAVAIISENDEGLVASTGFAVLLSKDNIDRYYSFAALKNQFTIKQLIRKASGGMYPAIAEEEVMSLKIPIPSPEIQKYIGDKVRRAEELREEAKRLKKETEDLIINKLGTINLEENRNYSSAFISSGKIVERIDSEYYHSKYLKIEDELNRKGYKVKKLGEVCTRIFNGRTYSTTDKERKYCNVGVGELGDWFVNKSKEKFINEKVDKKYCLKANSIIWGNAAHLAKYIGEKVNIVLEEETVIPTTEVTAIEPNEEAIDPYYLFIFMRTQWGYYQIQRTVKGMTAHSYPQDISNILVPIIDLTNEELEVLKNNVITSYKNELNAKQLIQQAKQDVEDLIEGNFEMSKLNNDSSTESRC
jgi:type I restriction enzyme S subunit